MKIRTAIEKMARCNPEVVSPSYRVLKIVPVQTHRASTRDLFDTGAVPNLISAEMADHRNLFPRPIQKTSPVPDESNHMFQVHLCDFPMIVGDLTVPWTFLTIKDAPLGFITGSRPLRRLAPSWISWISS